MKTLAQDCPLWISLSIIAGLALGCRQPAPTTSRAPSLRVGVAEADITAPIGYRMAGYFNERLSTGTHDPLHAKALVLQQGPEQIAMVFCDLVGLSLNVTTNARALASTRTGIPVSHITICATHSHTGPLFEGPLREYFHQASLAKQGTDPCEQLDYPAFLIEQLAKVIASAQADLQPAQLQAGITKQEGLTFNRRYWMKDGKVVFNPGRLNPDIVRPAGPSDSDLGILLARAPSAAEPFAGLTVFAMHSDTVGGTLYSADYEYYLEQTLQRGFGKKFLSAFGLGTCGDLNHIDVSKQESLTSFAFAEYAGSTIGRTVLNAAPHLRSLSRPSLAVRTATVTASLKEVTPEQVADARLKMENFHDPAVPFLDKVAAVRILDLASLGSTRPLEVQVFRLDAETAIVCLPCEIFAELGLAIKKASPFKITFVLSICNDRPSYVPTEKAFREGSYEVTNARVKPGTGEILVSTANGLLAALKTAASP